MCTPIPTQIYQIYQIYHHYTVKVASVKIYIYWASNTQYQCARQLQAQNRRSGCAQPEVRRQRFPCKALRAEGSMLPQAKPPAA
jgi:hypothetical protein